MEGQVDWKPNDKFELWARAFTSGWNNRGDAGSRVGFANGSWDETTLTDGNAYVGGGLFVNPNFGYSAPNGNPTANATLIAHNMPSCDRCRRTPYLGTPPAGTVACDTDPVLEPVRPDSNNPSTNFSLRRSSPRTCTLNNYDDFNYIATYHAPGFDIKYNGGIQGYNYDLNDYRATARSRCQAIRRMSRRITLPPAASRADRARR